MGIKFGMELKIGLIGGMSKLNWLRVDFRSRLLFREILFKKRVKISLTQNILKKSFNWHTVKEADYQDCLIKSQENLNLDGSYRLNLDGLAKLFDSKV